jgi:hypothetical protein
MIGCFEEEVLPDRRSGWGAPIMQAEEIREVVCAAPRHAEDEDRIGILDVEYQRGFQSVGAAKLDSTAS